MAASDTAKDLAVYVIGISGKCSKNYIGCGKSCLCRQYMYNEYIEESYSTLLQSEFDGCVINQQHVIYWGKKEETYKEMTKGQCSFVAKVNFEVFEHTIFYQDGANQPFHGYEKYEKRVFTHLKGYLGKYAFKSRDEVLTPEDYGSKKFSYSNIVPVAYLYVVDVSQSCCVFEDQMQLMSTLVKSIHLKKQSCVVVASKFDTHCQVNVERLESLASKLKVPIIQCSAKDNTNVDTAFKYLAMKALSLKKLSANVLTHGEVVVQKRAITPTKDEQDDINIDVIPHISMANKSWSVIQDPTEDHCNLLDVLTESTCISTDISDESPDNSNGKEKKSEAASNPEVVHDLEEHTYDLLYENDSTTMQPELLNSEEHFYKQKRSTMPLPRTPLEKSLLSDSSSVFPIHANGKDIETNFQDTEQMDELTSPNMYEKIDFRTPDVKDSQKKSLVIYTESNKLKGIQKDSSSHVKEDELSEDSEGYVIEHIDFGHPVTEKDTQENMQGDKLSDESEGYVIEQINFDHPVTDKMQSLYLEVTGTSNTMVKGNNEPEYYECCEVERLRTPSPLALVASTSRSDASVQHSSAYQLSDSLDGNSRTIQSMDTDGKIIAESPCNVPRSLTTQSSIPELHCIDSTSSSYIYMHEVDSPSLKQDSDTFTYDYVRHSYIQRCMHRRQYTGVPPRKVKRIVHENTNLIKEHITCVNFKSTEKHAIILPPRETHKRLTSQQPTNYKPPVPPRNIPRPGCYLSAPSAAPEGV